MWRIACRLLAAIAAIVFLASLYQPVVFFADQNERVWNGTYMLIWGWAGPMGDLFHWYANILLLIALTAVTGRYYLIAFAIGIIGAYFAHDFHGYTVLPWFEDGGG